MCTHQWAMWDSGISASGTQCLGGIWALWTWLTCHCAPEAFLSTVLSWFTGLFLLCEMRAGLTQKAGCKVISSDGS